VVLESSRPDLRASIAAGQYKWDAYAKTYKFKYVEDGSDEVIKSEGGVSQNLQEDSTEEASTPCKKRCFAETEPAKAKAKAKTKMTPEDSHLASTRRSCAPPKLLATRRSRCIVIPWEWRMRWSQQQHPMQIGNGYVSRSQCLQSCVRKCNE